MSVSRRVTFGRLRVGVPAALEGPAGSSGRGRMWREVLSRLSVDVDLRFVSQPSQRRFDRPRVDVWLTDGHQGALAVSEPQVAHLLEASWHDPDTLATCEPEFLRVEIPSEQAARAAAVVICLSEWSKCQIVESYGLDPSRVVVGLLGVDHRIFRPGVSGGDAIVERCGGKADKPYVLFVSSVHPRKNLSALRDAMTKIGQSGFAHQLVIVGGPAHGRSDHELLFRQATAELPGLPGRLVSVPFGLSDEELAALMAGAAAFCQPSLSEGFGLPALEAMACGAPTVVANRGALPEVAGDAAVRVDVDALSIARGLEMVLSSPDTARRVGVACAERARSFTWERCTDSWHRALLIGSGRVAPDGPPSSVRHLAATTRHAPS